MDLTISEDVLVSEGVMQEVCVTVSNQTSQRERDIHISYSVIPNSITSGMTTIIIIHLIIIVYNVYQQLSVISKP